MYQFTHKAITGGMRSLIPYTLMFGTSLFLLAACTSKPLPPTQEIATAEQSMVDAEQARVAQYALPELQEARRKLAAARIAVQNEDMLLAKRMAQQASVDIRFASAIAELAKAEAVNTDMNTNIDVLKEEMQRKTGAPQ
jgi:FKBP-type peptidyl-prolyl cis-trans isomerase (trigger factor)